MAEPGIVRVNEESKFKHFLPSTTHEGRLQVRVSYGVPKHGLPPFFGNGASQIFTRLCVPPHSLEQPLQAPHSPQPPSTEMFQFRKVSQDKGLHKGIY